MGRILEEDEAEDVAAAACNLCGGRGRGGWRVTAREANVGVAVSRKEVQGPSRAVLVAMGQVVMSPQRKHR